MTFADQLNDLIEQIGCTNKQLSDAAQLSPGAITRYRNAERVPQPESEPYVKLVQALSVLSAATDHPFSVEELSDIFSKSSNAQTLQIEYSAYIQKLNQLLKGLDIKSVDLAHFLHSDPSWVSRILSGQRQPSDLLKFTNSVADYIAGRFHDSQVLPTLLSILEIDAEHEASEISRQSLQEHIIQWLGTNPENPANDPIQSFLEKLDEFDLNAFMRSIHFQEMKVPTLPFHMPGSKYYSGIEEMKQAELDFLKTTVTSKAMDDVIFYSDMPIAEMAEDEDFKKKWMFGMAMMLRKGLHLHIVHDVHRPFPEMLLGLGNWIPMYMTGQISPYYFKEPTNSAFLHFIRSSGSASITGEAIAGCQECGRYIGSKNKDDIQYMRLRAEKMLSVAKPLMHIYREDRSASFHDRLRKLRRNDDNYRLLGSAPPIFTMSEALLKSILRRNQTSGLETEQILSYRKELIRRLSEKDIRCKWSIELPLLSDNEYSEHPVRLPLSELFISQDLCYTLDEYKQHLEQTKEFVNAHNHFTLHLDPGYVFRNIRITICEDRYVLVSKSNIPAIHFILYHPKMITAFEGFQT